MATYKRLRSPGGDWETVEGASVSAFVVNGQMDVSVLTPSESHVQMVVAFVELTPEEARELRESLTWALGEVAAQEAARGDA